MGEPSEVIIPVFGILDITGEVVGMWFLTAALVIFSLIVAKNLKERPGKLQNALEWGVDYLYNFFAQNLGDKRTRKYFFFLGSLFLFIIVSNYSGMIPGFGLTKYVKAPTSSLSVTLGLGVCVFIFLQAAGVKLGVKQYFKRFVTPIAVMLPLLVLDEFIKPASLALRLFGNIFGEEMVTENLYELLPIGAPLLMMVLSTLFCALQAIVYTMLVSIYLSEVTECEVEEHK